jgi:hypothetical protein
VLTITPVSGDPITLSSRDVADPRQRSGFSRHVGLAQDSQVTFFFNRYLRARLPELEALAGLGVTQTVNRAGKVQLVSVRPCSFVRFGWDAALIKGWAYGWGPPHSLAQVEGVFEITDASLDGLGESLALTIYRGDWLYKADGIVERFV